VRIDFEEGTLTCGRRFPFLPSDFVLQIVRDGGLIPTKRSGKRSWNLGGGGIVKNTHCGFAATGLEKT
jgi:hypothetical protein